MGMTIMIIKLWFKKRCYLLRAVCLTVTKCIDNIPFQHHGPEDKPVSTLKEVEEATIKVKNEEEADKEEASLVSQITSWATLRPLLITCYLHFVQNWCGVNVIVFKVS